jgi:hypothetical protein
MAGPTVLDFARMADACYYSSERLVPNFTRIHYGQLTSGFKASRYVIDRGGALHVVASFAGTDSDETEITDSGDKLADLGFAGSAIVSGLGAVSPVLGAALTAGKNRLKAQIAGAEEFVKQAVYFAGSGARVFVTGHSLGGGLAQILSAMTGLPGLAFNAPAVSQLGYKLKDANQFLNVNQANDPVSAGTGMFGKHLGQIHQVNSGVGIAQAHFLAPLIAYLEAGGGAKLGKSSPF